MSVTGDLPFPAADERHLHDLGEDTVGCMARLHAHYGPVAAFAKGSDLTLFAFGPEANRTVLSDPATFHVYGPPGPRNSAQRRFGQGLFGLNGAKQQQHRRMLMPPLSRPAVEASAGAMRSIIDDHVAAWRPGRTFDLHASMKDLSLRLAGRLLFGLETFSAAAEVAAAFQEWLDEYVRVLFAMTLPLDLPGDRYQRWLAAGERFEAHLWQLIRERRDGAADGPNDLVALLLKARAAGQITDAELIGEMQTLFNAAYQTTASAMTWTLLLLTQHPDVLSDVLDEQRRPAPKAVLERAVRESLRILPAVVFVIRRAARPAVLLGRPIPEGTVVVLSIYVTHHQPESFADPERFWPDRWLGRPASPYAYVPFGTGPRMCVGAAFSTQLLHLAVPAVLTRYRLAVAPGTRIDRHSSLTMGVDGGLPVTPFPQDGRAAAVPLTGNVHDMVHFPPADAGRRAA